MQRINYNLHLSKSLLKNRRKNCNLPVKFHQRRQFVNLIDIKKLLNDFLTKDNFFEFTINVGINYKTNRTKNKNHKIFSKNIPNTRK